MTVKIEIPKQTVIIEDGKMEITIGTLSVTSLGSSGGAASALPPEIAAISSTALYYDAENADSRTESGGVVTELASLVPNTPALVAPSGFEPSMSGDLLDFAEAEYMVASGLSLNSNVTILFLGEIDVANNGNSRIVGMEATNGGSDFNSDEGFIPIYTVGNGNLAIMRKFQRAERTMPTSGVFLATVQATDDEFSMAVNDGAASVNSTNGTPSVAKLSIGATPTGGSTGLCKMSRMLVLEGATAQDISDAKTYLLSLIA